MSGEGDYLKEDLGSYLNVVGRIKPKDVWTYIEQIKLNLVSLEEQMLREAISAQRAICHIGHTYR